MKHEAAQPHSRPDDVDFSKAPLVRRGPRGPVHLPLRVLREAAGFTQAQVAKATGMAQGDVSVLEREASLDRREIRTLRQYLAAIGDDIEIAALSPFGHRTAIVGAHAQAPLRVVPEQNQNAQSPWSVAKVAELKGSTVSVPTTKSTNEHACPQRDPTIEKVDELLQRLVRFREILVEIGDPREEAASAAVRVRELVKVLLSAEESPDTVSAALAEQPRAVARHNVLWPAALAREQIERTIDRLQAAFVDPEQSDEEIRDLIARYLDTLVDKLRLGKHVEKIRLEAQVRSQKGSWSALENLLAPENLANHMIEALRRHRPAYGKRLEQHRAELVDRMAKLKAAPGRGRPKAGAQTHAVLKAEDLREEILGWLFQTATAGAIKARRSRKRKK